VWDFSSSAEFIGQDTFSLDEFTSRGVSLSEKGTRIVSLWWLSVMWWLKIWGFKGDYNIDLMKYGFECWNIVNTWKDDDFVVIVNVMLYRNWFFVPHNYWVNCFIFYVWTCDMNLLYEWEGVNAIQMVKVMISCL